MTDSEKLQQTDAPFTTSTSGHNACDQNGGGPPTTVTGQSPNKIALPAAGPTWSSSEPSVAANSAAAAAKDERECVSMEQSTSRDMELGSFDEGEAEDLSMSCDSTPCDKKFDTTIGHIEDIIMEEQFHQLQQSFLEKYYLQFDLDTDENKLCYTEIHEEYITILEHHLDTELNRRMPGFNLEEFFTQLLSQKDMLEGEIFEMLFTFTDFMAFKEMMLDFRREKEGLTTDLSSGLTVTSLAMGEPTFGLNAHTIDLFPPGGPQS
ncbi:ADP-ribosylation factor-like protein 2-binding protein [Tubulanus polymorphus]|uniref:ADP-ribosylation factor-like protein 2-binding protein n=1 Tax=Tubulanus polymorphus TaxID=672921 RepID=UPI003DA574B4